MGTFVGTIPELHTLRARKHLIIRVVCPKSTPFQTPSCVMAVQGRSLAAHDTDARQWPNMMFRMCE